MINLDWVKDYIDLSDQDLKELAVKITKAGINIEKVIQNRLDNLVIGKVLTCKPHPDSDHLNICEVDIKTQIIQIVCGASNVKAGIKVIVALPGCILPGNFEIKKSNIRNQESNGMICALFELGIEEKNEENYNKGIHVITEDVKIGTDANEYLNTNTTLYELDIHKHRNNDCYYHIGFAYEIACILNRKVVLPKDNYQEIPQNINDLMTLEVITPKCPYYLGKMVKDIQIKPSPDFIQKRLMSVGLRPINNVVDISNYVMLEYGQPLHFFDYAKLGNKVLVRDAKNQEKITTLDKQQRVLNENDIVVTNGSVPVCVAGVMGGENTEVDENTQTIFIESAIFDSVSIRTTANKLNLPSEASIRYGKGLSYEYTNKAINRACHLLEKYANAKVLSGKLVYDKIDKTLKHVQFKTSQINSLLGITLSDVDVETELNRLDFKYTLQDGIFDCEIPARRLDIDPNINDIAEEIGRLYGYHNLKSTLPSIPTRRGVYVKDVKLRKQISKRLRTLGLNETKTYTLISPSMAKLFKYEDKNQITLPNPMSIDKSIIRTTLLPSLLKVYEYNKARKVPDIFLYEIAKTYDVNYQEESKIAILMQGDYIQNSWLHNNVKCDFFLIKGIIENILDYLGFKNRYTFIKESIPDFHPGISAKILLDREEIGVVGKIHPQHNQDDIFMCELSMSKIYNKSIKPLKYKESSKFPQIIKDVAFVVDKNTQSEDIKRQIQKFGGRLLTNIEVFDVYELKEENKKSIAFKLTFQDPSRTLTEEEVLNIFNKIIIDIENNLDAKLRN